MGTEKIGWYDCEVLWNFFVASLDLRGISIKEGADDDDVRLTTGLSRRVPAFA